MVHIPIEYATLPSSPIRPHSSPEGIVPAQQSPEKAKPTPSALEKAVATLADTLPTRAVPNSQSAANPLSRQSSANSLQSRSTKLLNSFDLYDHEVSGLDDFEIVSDDEDDLVELSAEQKQTAYSECQMSGSALVQSRFEENGFPELLTKLGDMRNELANLHQDPKKADFGIQREPDTGIRRNRSSTEVNDHNYPEHMVALTQFLKGKIGELTDEESTLADFSHHYTTETGDDITTTEMIVLSRNVALDRIPFRLGHTNATHLKTLEAEASKFFNQTVSRFNVGDTPGAVSALSKFVYVFAHAMPFYRGSAMVGEIFTHGMLEKIGVHKDFDDLKGLDFLAFTNTQENFEAAFKAKLAL